MRDQRRESLSSSPPVSAMSRTERSIAEMFGPLMAPAFFKALAEPNRIKILQWLALGRKRCSVSEVAEILPVDKTVVSRHLATLRDAGILAAERSGKEIFYTVRTEWLVSSLRRLADALERCC